MVEEEEVEKLRAVAEETSFELLMVRKKKVKMTMKMRVNLKVMRVKTQSLKVRSEWFGQPYQSDDYVWKSGHPEESGHLCS